jgi:hypothetical protein
MSVEGEMPRRRRATSASVTASRSAMAVVRALHSEISKVQARAAFLVSVSCRCSRQNEDREKLEAEAAALQSMVEAYSSALSERLQNLPSDIRDHGRILDTVRALRSVHAILETARSNFNARASSASRMTPTRAVNGYGVPGGST